MNFPVEFILLIPVISGILCFLSPRERIISYLSIALAILGTAYTFYVCGPIFLDGTVVEYGFWYVDAMSSFFMMITSTVALMVALYSRGYLGHEREERVLKTGSEKYYYLYLNLFVAVMLAVYSVSSVGMVWIVIEVTTLISTFLVGFYHDERSTEAAWKYLIICSIGITLALIGISLVYASAYQAVPEESMALDWKVLMASAPYLDPALLKTAMVFIVIGFGTKAGFAPMHTWLPDAHSQAPTPVSALLSATLLNCALYSILRFYAISEITIPEFTSTLLIIFGFLSLFIAAMFILNARDIKRMLAYSSIEHIGLISIAFGIGSELSIYAGLFMVMAHSLTKPILFFCAGNIMQAYGTKNMDIVRGMGTKMPFTAALLSIGALAVVGMPPFAVFMGDFFLFLALADAGMWYLLVIAVILIIIIFSGFARHIYPMLTGETTMDVHDPPGISRHAPFLILVVGIILLGVFVPHEMSAALTNIVNTVFGGVI
ncbi:MAG: hydrogenase 4 subunit F [archaeon]|nr:hydrogenase 4 subunit F [archaeon]